MIFSTCKDYRSEHLSFVGSEGNRRNALTFAGIQSFCKGNSFNIGYCNGKIDTLELSVKEKLVYFI